jgi:hypothetical protein
MDEDDFANRMNNANDQLVHLNRGDLTSDSDVFLRTMSQAGATMNVLHDRVGIVRDQRNVLRNENAYLKALFLPAIVVGAAAAHLYNYATSEKQDNMVQLDGIDPVIEFKPSPFSKKAVKKKEKKRVRNEFESDPFEINKKLKVTNEEIEEIEEDLCQGNKVCIAMTNGGIALKKNDKIEKLAEKLEKPVINKEKPLEIVEKIEKPDIFKEKPLEIVEKIEKPDIFKEKPLEIVEKIEKPLEIVEKIEKPMKETPPSSNAILKTLDKATSFTQESVKDTEIATGLVGLTTSTAITGAIVAGKTLNNISNVFKINDTVKKMPKITKKFINLRTNFINGYKTDPELAIETLRSKTNADPSTYREIIHDVKTNKYGINEAGLNSMSADHIPVLKNRNWKKRSAQTAFNTPISNDYDYEREREKESEKVDAEIPKDVPAIDALTRELNYDTSNNTGSTVSFNDKQAEEPEPILKGTTISLKDKLAQEQPRLSGTTIPLAQKLKEDADAASSKAPIPTPKPTSIPTFSPIFETIGNTLNSLTSNPTTKTVAEMRTEAMAKAQEDQRLSDEEAVRDDESSQREEDIRKGIIAERDRLSREKYANNQQQKADTQNTIDQTALPILPNNPASFGVQGDIEMSDVAKGVLIQSLLSGISSSAYSGADLLQTMAPHPMGLASSYALRAGGMTVDAIQGLYGSSFNRTPGERRGAQATRQFVNSWSQGPVIAAQRGLNALSNVDGGSEKTPQSVVDVFAGSAKGFSESLKPETQMKQAQQDYTSWYNHASAPFAV